MDQLIFFHLQRKMDGKWKTLSPFFLSFISFLCFLSIKISLTKQTQSPLSPLSLPIFFPYIIPLYPFHPSPSSSPFFSPLFHIPFIDLTLPLTFHPSLTLVHLSPSHHTLFLLLLLSPSSSTMFCKSLGCDFVMLQFVVVLTWVHLF